jgi:hypothetical protein
MLIEIGASGLCRRQERKCHCGFWGRAILARCWRLNSGIPYAFASYFAPELLIPALRIYRGRFKPSEQLDRLQHHRRRQR